MKPLPRKKPKTFRLSERDLEKLDLVARDFEESPATIGKRLMMERIDEVIEDKGLAA